MKSQSLKTLAERFRNRLDSLKLTEFRAHDKFIIVCLHEAILALEQGNYGVGAALVRDQIVLKTGHNQVFAPYFRSDLHAEMTVLNAYEDEARGTASLHSGSTLFTSVEPCVMCFTRLINAGVQNVFYAAAEPTGGMESIKNNLPEAWQKIQSGSGTVFAPADCSKELSQMANEILWSSAESLEETLRKRL